MLKNDFEPTDLIAERKKTELLIPSEVQNYFYETPEVLHQMHFPVLEYPKKVTSLNLDKTPNFSGKLAGIKGQYLIFENGTVFNVRTFEGFVVKVTI